MQASRSQAKQSVPQSRSMNFATQVIIARRRLGHCEQILTVARADLEVNGPSSGINTVKTRCQILQSHAVTRPQLAQCLSLPTCRAAFANDETTNRPRSPRYCGGTPGWGRAQEKKVPSMGEDAEAYGRFGMRPAGKASRPASIAFRIADDINTGCFASAIAVFINTASQLISMATLASDAVPTPASAMTGTLLFSTMVQSV